MAESSDQPSKRRRVQAQQSNKTDYVKMYAERNYCYLYSFHKDESIVHVLKVLETNTSVQQLSIDLTHPPPREHPEDAVVLSTLVNLLSVNKTIRKLEFTAAASATLDLADLLRALAHHPSVQEAFLHVPGVLGQDCIGLMQALIRNETLRSVHFDACLTTVCAKALMDTLEHRSQPLTLILVKPEKAGFLYLKALMLEHGQDDQKCVISQGLGLNDL